MHGESIRAHEALNHPFHCGMLWSILKRHAASGYSANRVFLATCFALFPAAAR